MARSKSTTSYTRQRDVSLPSLATLLAVPITRPVVVPVVTPAVLPDIEDRRQWSPARGVQPPGTSRPGAARVRAKGLYGLKFTAPRHVAICARRKIRKEVLHAIGKAGSGSGRSQKRRNFWSTVSC